MADKKTKTPKNKDEKGGKNKANIYQSQNVYPNRAEIEKFTEFKITAQEPDTVLLLLASKENEVILRALNHLVKYAEKLPENALVLHKLKTTESILDNKLWDHELLFIRRFALKLIAEIFQLENEEFDEITVEQLYSISRDNYMNATDDFIIEYSSAILYSLLREPRICSILEEDIEFTNTVFNHIGETKDPDILYNSYNILIKIFQSASSILQLCGIEAFPFERVLGDICSEYPEIQKAALETFGEVVSCKNEFYESRFICPMFFEEMFKVLENDLWEDRHLPIIDLLRQLMAMEKIARVFCRDECLPRFISYVKHKEPYKSEALGVLVEIAQFEEHLENLYLLSVVNVLLDFLKEIDKVNEDVCLGLKRMMKNSDALGKIVNDDPAPHFLKVIKTDAIDWQKREAAADALRFLLNRSHKACESAVKNGISGIISRLLKKKFGDVPIDFLMTLAHILITLAKDHEIREQVMTDELAGSLFYAIQNSLRSAILTANLFNCATAYICEKKLANEFLTNSMDIVLQALKSQAVIVKTAAADFIIVTGKLKEFADEYIENGVLQYLLEDDKALSTCPSWSPAIEAILSTNPTLKFSIRGRLEITDFTGEDFAVSKFHWQDFVILRQLMKEDVSPLYPVILMNFEHLDVESEAVIHVKIAYSDTDLPVEPIKNPDDSETTSLSDWTYCRRPPDERLPMYLEQLRTMLEARGLIDSTRIPNSIDITKIADRVKIVSEIVCNEMCGTMPGEHPKICSESAVISHLNEIKCSLHCNIIPLGRIRFGGHFERAILFKGLADRIGLPATLVRGVDGKILYNEIPLPEQAEQPDCSLTILPMRLLTPTHIVDLMDYPGELYPLQSRKSYRYQRLL